MKSEAEIATRIARYLDTGGADLKPGTAYRLQLAREQALARLAEPARASEFALSGAGGHATGGRRHVLADVRIWVGILLIVGGVLSYQYWQSARMAREIVDTDAAILTSDLPIEAYVDRGFLNWLKGSEP